uniref:Uncharacterized protein n=1 Tax=Tanacetum cinerariifolium TaxID=118510 RepID=A0A6L2L8C7_TANCI|nr:hypothetical protein [Tanacetum cinerariifolium]
MALERPLLASFYLGGHIVYANGLVKHRASTSTFTVVLRRKMHYHEFVSMIYQHLEVARRIFKLKITLHFEHCGEPKSSPITSEETLDVIEEVELKYDEFIEVKLNAYSIKDVFVTFTTNHCINLLLLIYIWTSGVPSLYSKDKIHIDIWREAENKIFLKLAPSSENDMNVYVFIAYVLMIWVNYKDLKFITSKDILISNIVSMDLKRPFPITFHIGSDVQYVMNELVRRAGNLSFTVVARRKMPYQEFVSLIYRHVGVNRSNFMLRITLDLQDCEKPYKTWSIKDMCSKHGKPNSSEETSESLYLHLCEKTPIMSEETLDLMYFLAETDEDFGLIFVLYSSGIHRVANEHNNLWLLH